MIDEAGNEIDNDFWADMMEAYAQGFVSGAGGDGGFSEDVENEALSSEDEMIGSKKSVCLE